MRFPIVGERVTCRGLKLTNSLGKLNNNLHFRLACDQVVLLETEANLSASRRKANDFFTVFFFCGSELGGITNTKWLVPREIASFVSPRPGGSQGNKTHCLPWSQSLSAYYISQSKSQQMNINLFVLCDRWSRVALKRTFVGD